MAAQPGDETTWDMSMSRRKMLVRTSAGLLTIVGGTALVACGSDDATSSPSTTSSTGGEPSATATSTATTAEATPTAAAPAEPVSITQLLSTPGPSFINAPTAIATEMGFYTDQLVDVTTEYPGSSIRSIQTMVGGSGTIAVADAFAILVGTAEELDLRSVYLTARGYVFGFAVDASSPIQEWSLDTVQGSRIGITDFAGGEVPVLRGALARLGLSEGGGDDGVELVVIGGGGAETADAIQSGSVDIFAGSVLDFEIFKAAGVDVQVITPDYIANFPGQAFTTTPSLLEDNRPGMTGLLKANAMATVFMHANPMASAEIAIAAAPASAEGIPVELVAGLLTSTFVDGNAYAFDPDDPNYHMLGIQDPAAYDDFQQFLIETGSESDDGTTLTEEVEVEPIVDNSFIDAANDFDYAEIEALAEGS